MPRYLLCMCLLFTIALPCSAQGDKAKPNTLTPKEISDGWILLFDGETTFGWKNSFGQRPRAKVENGVISARDEVLKTTSLFQDFEMSFEYHLDVGTTHVGIEYVPVGGGGKGFVMVLDKVGEWTPFQVEAKNGFVYPNNVKGDPLKIRWDKYSTVFFNENANLQLRNVKLRPLNTTSLFNGKDLTGWKTFPGDKYKSKFSVNDKGELNVKDGPGDLQTVGKYKDFILQLECISNGKHLNSGIFFRCRDGEYQNGYEAQIRNQFTKEPTQKYLVEEYDPKTNKLVGKKEVLSTAFDFGTGAIYRRVPARKEMSKDGEWFSMTIAAQGNHFATWVNGVQVTDWTDNRPKTDNARTGCRLEAGHLSIQGHDPTTDLSFRNIRITEMK
jgi:hypothetical protein